MNISLINMTNGLISDSQLQQAIRAINRQVNEDFSSYWGAGALLRLEGHGRITNRSMEESAQAADMRGNAVIYLWDPAETRSALGYHARNFRGVPYGFVFPQVSRSLGEPWTVTLSHEVLEMIADPEVNRLVKGPHPASPRLTVFYWYEVCDAVQSQTYEIDGVPVSNFVLPLYFTSSDEPGGRNDFLNLSTPTGHLKSFGVSPGGYAGFYNPSTGTHETFLAEGDQAAVMRFRTKSRLGLARRSQRYQQGIRG